MLAAVPIGTMAQYDPHYSHYYDMEAAYNPAAVGKESKLNIVGAYAMSLAVLNGIPVRSSWEPTCLSMR